MKKPKLYKYFSTKLQIAIFIFGILCTATKTHAQLKFGLGVLGFGIAATPSISEEFSPVFFAPYLELGYLVKDHYEPGLRFNAELDANGYSNVGIMPYLRYYFLKNIKFRPYFFGGLGFSSNGNIWIQNRKGRPFNHPSFGQNYALGFRAGGGVRVVRFLDFGLMYYYAGWVNGTRSIDFADPTIRQSVTYQVHFVEVQMAFVFGGNLKKKEKE